jgi:light-regulated signal transduction histidine kinase (bacteriophytochrome)
LSASAALHLEKLDRSAQQTVGRLREGLEKLATLLVEALELHGEVMTQSEKELAEENRQHLSEVEAALGRSMVSAAERQEKLIRQSEELLKEMQIALVEAAGATIRQQEELVRQGDVLLKVVDATGQLKMLEESLNDNLAAVQKTHNFEDMAVSLSAAIQLLSARLGHYPLGARSREVAGGDAANQAA